MSSNNEIKLLIIRLIAQSFIQIYVHHQYQYSQNDSVELQGHETECYDNTQV
jgi:hypothetical protein